MQADLSAARSEASPFHGVAAPASEGWWSSSYKRAQPAPAAARNVAVSAPAHTHRGDPQEGDPAHGRGYGAPERAGSHVLSDEEVEEAEASDSFPALGYPVGLGSQLGSGARHHSERPP
jgi:hypothetical protein